MTRLRSSLGAAGAVTIASAVLLAGGASAAPKVRVAAGGLNSPKHLLYTARGIYVAESGTGGPAGTSCVTGPSAEGPGTTKYCAGLTGAIGLVRKGHVRVALGKLASVADAEGEAAGPAAMAVGPRGRIVVVYQDELVAANGSTGVPAPASAFFGTLQLGGGKSADIAAFSASHPQEAATLGGIPGETTYDSDPYDVISYRGGYVVADAAANSLLRVTRKGKVSLLARFPTQAETVPAGVFGPGPVPVNAQAVPTAVAVGPDGALYVGELRGVPSEPGTSFVYRVVPGHAPTVWATGLTAVTAIAFDRKGRLLATELSSGGLLAAPKVPGALVRVSANGKKVTQLPVTGLSEPTGVAVAPDGAVYVSNNGASPGSASPGGQVLEITGLK